MFYNDWYSSSREPAACVQATHACINERVACPPSRPRVKPLALRLRLFLDHTIAEAYWQNRVAMTLPLSSADWRADTVELLVLASEVAPVVVPNATVWSVGSMWITPEQVLDPAASKTVANLYVDT